MQKAEKARSVRAFRALLYLRRQIMSEVASTSAADNPALMTKTFEHERPAAEDG